MISLGKTKLIIGHTWLHHHNLEIDWTTGKLTLTQCPSDCHMTLWRVWSEEQQKKKQTEEPTMEETEEEPLILEKGDAIFAAYFPDKEQHSKIV